MFATGGIVSAIRLRQTPNCWTSKAVTSRPFVSNARVRVTMTRKDQKVEALGVIRIVKPRIGMGIEFIDLESRHLEVLRRWVEQVSKSR